MIEETSGPPLQVNEADSRIVVILNGRTSTPKYIDFHAVNPFQLVAIGEWISLKGKQMMAMGSEDANQQANIVVPEISDDIVKEILGVTPT